MAPRTEALAAPFTTRRQPSDTQIRALLSLGAGLQRIVPRRLAVVPIGLWMGVIWTSSSIDPGSALPSIRLSPFTTNFLHAPLFGMLALLGCLALPREAGWPRLTLRTCALVVAGVVLYGVVDELHQSLSPARDASLLDVLTDGVGAASLVFVAAYLGRAFANRRGLSRRVALALLACAVAAAAATWLPELFGSPGWI